MDCSIQENLKKYYISITIDSNLSSKKYINNIMKKAYYKLYALRKFLT